VHRPKKSHKKFCSGHKTSMYACTKQEDSEIEEVGATATILTLPLRFHNMFVRYAHRFNLQLKYADLPTKSKSADRVARRSPARREGDASTVWSKCSSECLGNSAHLTCCHCSAARSCDIGAPPPQGGGLMPSAFAAARPTPVPFTGAPLRVQGPREIFG